MNTMNIYSPRGTKVIVTEDSINSGYPADEDLAKKYLEVGRTYTVERTVVDNWHTNVWLQEFPPEVYFNSVSFEEKENKIAKLTKDPLDKVSAIGAVILLQDVYNRMKTVLTNRSSNV